MMDDKNYAQTKLQTEMSAWFQRGEPNIEVTLRFRGVPVSYKMAEKAMGSFAHGIKRYLFGAKSKKRIFMVPVIEGYAKGQSYAALYELSDDTHIHCLLKLPGNPLDHKEKLREFWLASSVLSGDPNIYCPKKRDEDNDVGSGEGWFKPLSSDDLQVVFTNYNLKTCGREMDPVLLKFVPSSW